MQMVIKNVVALNIVGNGPLSLPPALRKVINALRRQHLDGVMTVEHNVSCEARVEKATQVSLLKLTGNAVEHWKKTREIFTALTLRDYWQMGPSAFPLSFAKLVPVVRTPIALEGYSLASEGVPFPMYPKSKGRRGRDVNLLEIKLDDCLCGVPRPDYSHQELSLYAVLDTADPIGERAFFWWMIYASEETDSPLPDLQRLMPGGPLWAGITDLTGQMQVEKTEDCLAGMLRQARNFVSRLSGRYPGEVGLQKPSLFYIGS